jgi:transcriptional regulator with XRE-family HTH domain
MEDAATRLKRARIKAGYKTAKAAADRFGWVLSTYRSHENGQTPVPVSFAKRYARAFRVTPDWLLFDNNDATSIDQLLEGKPARIRRIARRLVEALLSEDR